MQTLAVHTHPNGLLAALAPLGLALARTTALVIDLDPTGVRLPGTSTLRDLVETGPTSADLHPRRRGVAVLPNGGISPDDAREEIAALTAGWPAVVIRLPSERTPTGGPAVGFRPVLPGITLPTTVPSVLQPTGLTPVPPEAGGLVLPRLSGRVARDILRGVRTKGRWVSACLDVWSLR